MVTRVEHPPELAAAVLGARPRQGQVADDAATVLDPEQQRLARLLEHGPGACRVGEPVDDLLARLRLVGDVPADVRVGLVDEQVVGVGHREWPEQQPGRAERVVGTQHAVNRVASSTGRSSSETRRAGPADRSPARWDGTSASTSVPSLRSSRSRVLEPRNVATTRRRRPASSGVDDQRLGAHEHGDVACPAAGSSPSAGQHCEPTRTRPSASVAPASRFIVPTNSATNGVAGRS